MRLVLIAWTVLAGAWAEAKDIRVAVAANFKPALHMLAPNFEAASGHRLVLSSGSTGMLYAQIVQGAPYDVFLAADRTRPAALIEAGLAQGPAPTPYAKGRLVLVFRDAHAGGAGPDLSAVQTMAIANPRTAPYGRAAQQALQRLNPPPTMRTAIAGNVAGVAAALRAGAADAGLIARALVGFETENAWPVPADWHTPIEQTAVVLTNAQDRAAAQSVLLWLTGPWAKDQLRTLGYDVD